MMRLNYLPRKTLHHYRGSPLGSPNTTYTAHFIRPNFNYAKTSYMLGILGKISRAKWNL